MFRALPVVIDPESWIVAFHRTSPYWWVRVLACGHYKHVSAFAWVEALQLWVWYEVTAFRTRVLLLPESERATAWLVAQTADADLYRVARRRRDKPVLGPFSCISAIQHLLGIKGGALRPDGLLRLVRRNGGVLIQDGRTGKTDTHGGANPAAAAG